MSRLPGVLKSQPASRNTLRYAAAIAFGILVGLAVDMRTRPGSTLAPAVAAIGEDAAAQQRVAARVLAAGGAPAQPKEPLAVGQAEAQPDAQPAVQPPETVPAETRSEVGVLPLEKAEGGVGAGGTVILDAETAAKLRKLRSIRDEVLDEQQLNAGIAYQGNLARARDFMNKLVGGQPIKLALTGGSVSAGLGDNNFGNQAYKRLTEAFPNEGHTKHMGGIPGILSSYINACMRWHVPEDADLILVEFNVNDGFEPSFEMMYGGLNHPRRRPFERLLRKLLLLPRRPLVMLVHAFNYEKRLFMSSGEDQMNVFAQAYGIPALSFRNVMWHKSRRGEPGYSSEELMLEGGAEMHPNERGHLMMADLITGFLRRVGEGLILRPFSPEDQKTVDEDLLEPVLPDNDALGADNCIIDVKFKDLCTEHPGFEWTDEGRKKWGFVATEVESRLVFTINTRTTVPEGMADPHTVVSINHLRSYEHMGQAEVTCLAGCACLPSIIEGIWEQQNSQLDLHQMSVSQAEECKMQLRVTPETKSDGHKVKIQGVVVSDVAMPKGEMGERPYVLEPWQIGGSITKDVCERVEKARAEGKAANIDPNELRVCSRRR